MRVHEECAGPIEDDRDHVYIFFPRSYTSTHYEAPREMYCTQPPGTPVTKLMPIIIEALTTLIKKTFLSDQSLSDFCMLFLKTNALNLH